MSDDKGLEESEAGTDQEESGTKHFSQTVRNLAIALSGVYKSAEVSRQLSAILTPAPAPRTIRSWVTEANRDAKTCPQKAKNLQDVRTAFMYAIQEATQERILAEVVGGNGSLRELSVLMGIVTDKLLLLQGEPTERVETVGKVSVSVQATQAFEAVERLLLGEPTLRELPGQKDDDDGGNV